MSEATTTNSKNDKYDGGDGNSRAAKRLHLAVAQSVLCADPGDRDGLRAAGRDVRGLMREAHRAGARIVHFPEGATCSPNKYAVSADGPDTVGPADWSRFAWDVLRRELAETAALARELGLWTVLGSVHKLTPPNRPHNSLYVISDQGEVVTRYDERLLSHTKVSHLYSPGTEPLTFEVDGVRFGCALGIESHFPEVFTEYERLEVDCVLFSTTSEVNAAAFALEAQGHAAANGYWVSFAALAPFSPGAPSGLIGPDGDWLARCPADGSSAVAVADLDEGSPDAQVPVRHARPWRRTARSGIYASLVVQDARSTDRSTF
jgi:predicted amidohydrolase